MKNIYLDHAAATPLDGDVLAAMQPYLSDKFHNPSATYLAAKAVSKDIESAREEVAGWLGVRPPEIIFTAGGSEANNLAIHGIMRLYPEANMVISSVEHESVLVPAHNYNYRETAVLPDGRVDIAALEKSIDSNTVLVSVMYANNEIGTIEPLAEVAQLIKKVRHERSVEGNKLPLYFHTDACQATNYLDMHVNRLGADLMTLNSGKIYGPKQCGALYVRAGIRLKPLIDGGGQEFGVRSGTENVAGIIGFAAALNKAQTLRGREGARLQKLQKLFIDLLDKTDSRIKLSGRLTHRLPNNIHVMIPGFDNERLVMELDERGVQCAVGSACSASSNEPSHVLKALGFSDDEARSSLRFTMGRNTTEANIRQVVTILCNLIK